MIRQILVHPDDRYFQRILWIDDKKIPISCERSTVMYETSSAPFLAGRVLNQLIADDGSDYPLAVEPMTKGQYMDNISGGADSLDLLLLIVQNVIDLCKSVYFPLAKWKSNHPELLSFVNSGPPIMEHSFDSSGVKILGLLWESHATLTKRIMLSDVARIIYPLGLISPVIVQAKTFLQGLWLENWIGMSPHLFPPHCTDSWFPGCLSFSSLCGRIPQNSLS